MKLLKFIACNSISLIRWFFDMKPYYFISWKDHITPYNPYTYGVHPDNIDWTGREKTEKDARKCINDMKK